MSILRFIFKFITRKGEKKGIAKSVIFPVVGVALGTTVVLLTLAVMNGLEWEVFGKIKRFYPPAKIYIAGTQNGVMDSIRIFLDRNGIVSSRAIERNGIVHVGGDFRFVKVTAVENLDYYFSDRLSVTRFNSKGDEGNGTMVTGDDLLLLLGLEPGDSCELLSPVDIDLATGIFPKTTLNITGVFNLDILDVDANNVFIDYSTGRKLFRNHAGEWLYLSQELSEEMKRRLENAFPAVQISSWEGDYASLIHAMKLEKIAYSFFGLIIIFIAAFNMLSIMSMMVLRKIPQIGIIRALGFGRKQIASVFIVQAVGTGIIGSIIGLGLTELVIYFDGKYDLIMKLISGFPLSEFPLILSVWIRVAVFGLTLVILLFASLYPAKKAAGLNPIEAIDYIK